MKNSIRLLILCSLWAATPVLSAKVLIWDLGGTLFKVDRSYLAGKISTWHYIWYGKSHEELMAKTFDILGFIDGYQTGDTQEFVRISDGSAVPQAFVNWQLGIYTSKELLEKALAVYEELKHDDEHCDSHHDHHFYCSKGEYYLIKDFLEMLLVPATLAESMKPIKKVVRILKECAEKTNKDGTKEHQLFVLSNWDKDSFALLQASERSQQVFNYFDQEHIIVSSAIGKIKPHCDMYEHILKQFDLDPAECIFIDDQEENVQSARRCGMTAIKIQDEDADYKQLRRELQDLNVL